MPRSPRTRIGLFTLAFAVVAYCAVTAQSGNTTVNLPLPSGPVVIWGLFMAMFGEVGRRILKRLDTVVDNCEKLNTDFLTWRSEVKQAFLGMNGKGGALGAIDDIRDRLSTLEKKTEGL